MWFSDIQINIDFLALIKVFPICSNTLVKLGMDINLQIPFYFFISINIWSLYKFLINL